MSDFQTPPDVCEFMMSLIPPPVFFDGFVLEPTKGEGNIVRALEARGYGVVAPDDFFNSEAVKEHHFRVTVMNPPFSPMKLGYKILDRVMEISDYIVAIMPWLAIINGQKRTDKIMGYGLKQIIHLPRSVFPGARVQTCILVMVRGWKEQTTFSVYKRGVVNVNS